MTEPTPQAPRREDPSREDQALQDRDEHTPAPAAAPANPPATAPAPGLLTFSLGGRRAPGLFFVGWLLIVAAVGLGIFATAGAGAGPAGLAVWLLVFLAAGAGLVLLGGSQTLERKAAGADYAGPSPMVVLLAAVAITQIAGVAVGLPLSAFASSISRPVGDLLASLVQGLVFIFVVRLMVVGPGALSWRDMGLVGRATDAIRGLLGGAVFAGPIIVVTVLLAAVVVQLVRAVPNSPLPPTGTAEGLVLHLIAGALIAPIAEEVLFRGFALTAWRRTLGARAAILRSSLVFVLAHVLVVGGDSFGDAAGLAFVAGAVRVPIALALGWLYVRTGSLWGPIGLHAAYNGILIAIAEAGAAAG